MYKIQYRFNSNSTWTDCVWAGQLLIFKDKKAATKKADEYLYVAKQINSQYEYRVVEVW